MNAAKNSVVVIDGKRDKTVVDVVHHEIEMIRSVYPEVKVSGERSHHVLKFLRQSSLDPQQRVTLTIALEHYYPYQAPTVSLSRAKGTDVKLMQEEPLRALYRKITESIRPCLDSGVGCLMTIVSIVQDALDDPDESLLPPSTDIPPPSSGTTPPTSLAPGKSPTLTPIPLKKNEAMKLSILACHLLQKCCYLRNPESEEEAQDIFKKLLAYLAIDNEIIPYGDILIPWKNENFFRAFRIEIDLKHQNLNTPHHLLDWLWKVESGAATHASAVGRYKEEFIEQQRLGAGSFAPVFVCRKKLDGRQYAVKKIVMHKKKADIVLREVKTLANLNHKNIVRYYDAWVEDGCSEDLAQYIPEEDEEDEEESEESEESSSSGFSYLDSSSESTDSTECCEEPHVMALHSGNYQTLYIQMELCSSVTLRDLLNGNNGSKKLDILFSPDGVKVTSSILRQLLSVIAHTHHENIVHRDLKPENILFHAAENGIADNCTIRVVDFGLARELTDFKRQGSQMKLAFSTTTIADDLLNSPVQPAQFTALPSTCRGTVLYCAPEQNEGRKYTIKVDEFSVGMIALEMWLTVERVDFREIRRIMSEMWNSRHAKLPTWFVEKNEDVAKIITGLLDHDIERRLSCEVVLRDATLPGDPPEIRKALETVDRYGNRVIGSVLQRILQQDYQRRRLSAEDISFNVLLSSDVFTQLTRVTEMIGRLHGFALIPFLKCMIPVSEKLQKNSHECVVNSSGWSRLYSSFPHYSIASFLGSLKCKNRVSFVSYYCKDKPYINFTTPYKLEGEYPEVYPEPLYCLLHLLCCMKCSGKVQISVSHVTWMHATSVSRDTFHDDENREPSSPPLARFGGRKRSEVEVDHPVYVITESKNVASVLENVREDLSSRFPLLPNAEKREAFMLHFLSMLMDAVHFFEKYMFISFSVSVVVNPYLHPTEKVVPRDILFSDGVLVQCDWVPAHPSLNALPIAFGCTVDHSTTELDSFGSSTSEASSAFVLSVDAGHMSEILKSPSNLSMTYSVSVIDGVAFRPSTFQKRWSVNFLEVAVELWMNNIRACLACVEDDYSVFESRAVRHAWTGEHELVSCTMMKWKYKESITASKAAELFLNLASRNRSADQAEVLKLVEARKDRCRQDHSKQKRVKADPETRRYSRWRDERQRKSNEKAASTSASNEDADIKEYHDPSPTPRRNDGFTRKSFSKKTSKNQRRQRSASGDIMGE